MIEVSSPPFATSRISLPPGVDPKSVPKLHKNEVVEGKVLQSLSNNNSLLLIKGRKVMARAYVPLKEGSILSLKVEDRVPVPTFKLLGIKSTDSDPINVLKILSEIKKNPWNSINKTIHTFGLPKEALSPFRELMDDLTMRLFLKSSPELLRQCIEKSGLHWEAKLKEALSHKTTGRDPINKLIQGDLKGLVSRFIALEGKKEGSLKRFESTLNNIQLLNHLGLEQDRKIFLPIPMQFPDGLFTIGQLLIHLPEKDEDESSPKKEDKNVFRITFLLELSHLGLLRADMNIKEKEIEGKFLLTREETKLLIEKNIQILANRLQEKGFSIRCMECHLKDRELIEHSMIKEIIREEGNTISLLA